MDCWQMETLIGIASKVRKLVALDDFIDRHQKIEFTRIWVKIDLAEPLKSGVSIRNHKELFLQPFVYENELVVCYQCGWLCHGYNDCMYKLKEGWAHALQLENFFESPMVVEDVAFGGFLSMMVVRRISGHGWPLHRFDSPNLLEFWRNRERQSSSIQSPWI